MKRSKLTLAVLALSARLALAAGAPPPKPPDPAGKETSVCKCRGTTQCKDGKCEKCGSPCKANNQVSGGKAT
jgi:hypothetical protein